jgi:hypothetical protein
MNEPQIRALRTPGTIDPGDVLTGPVRAISRWHLEPGEALALDDPGTEVTIFVLAGSGTGAGGSARVPLFPGTSLTAPLGTAVTIVADSDGLRLLGVILAAGPPARTEAL